MAWIRTIPPDQADPGLRAAYVETRALYPAEYHGPAVPALVGPDGTAESIVSSHSLIPDALRHAFGTLAVLLGPELPLSRRQHEMIAAVVSATNACFY
ncbi:MAG TPA: hypothetical protein VM597_25575 [Gemmataceae bacterium]|jgi:hypothetical protein|nr:hypothetical protein [Gemmataceae bacterium]